MKYRQGDFTIYKDGELTSKVKATKIKSFLPIPFLFMYKFG